MIKVVVTLIFKDWDWFSVYAEQIVPESICDQDFISFWVSLNYCHRWIVAHRTNLLSTCFFVVNKSNSSIINEIWNYRPTLVITKHHYYQNFLTVVIINIEEYIMDFEIGLRF